MESSGSRPLCYVASPYSDSPQARVLESADAMKQIVAMGYEVFSPLLHWHYWDLIHPHPYEWYMDRCLSMVEKCDLLVRMPGVSPGSDREVAHAESLGIPVVFGLEGLAEFGEVV